MTKEELNIIIENHKHWIKEDCTGWEGMKANLRYANLSNADLRNADLRYANLSNANLRNANLSNADLRYADLSYADLSYANLSYANLRYANLSNANLRNANLSYADLLEARNLYVPYACPDFGVFIGWKKCKRQVPNIGEESVLVQLEIPEDAKRLSATGRKCRCDKAKVLRITNIDGTEEYETAYSTYDASFTYKVGETVSVDIFDENRWNECSTGIHFFINRQEAVNY